MCHHYGVSIQVKTDEKGNPIAFEWRHETYEVLEVIGAWHLRDRWWVSRAAADLGFAKYPSDRYYFRVQLPGLAFFEIYYDAAVNDWILDRMVWRDYICLTDTWHG
jgi:hypothetical protein